MKILFVRGASDKNYKRVVISTEGDTETYFVKNSLVDSLVLVRGARVSEDMLDGIKTADEYYRAMKRALSLLSYADNSKKSLWAKLVRAKFSAECASETVRECVRLGYINERKQLERLVSSLVERGHYGRIYIQRKLVQRGYQMSDISEVIDGLILRGEIDFSAAFRALCEKKGTESEEDKRALAYKYGFLSSELGE